MLGNIVARGPTVRTVHMFTSSHASQTKVGLNTHAAQHRVRTCKRRVGGGTCDAQARQAESPSE
eukprot:14227875-Alexandrium_andersonii.AAC.1